MRCFTSPSGRIAAAACSGHISSPVRVRRWIRVLVQAGATVSVVLMRWLIEQSRSTLDVTHPCGRVDGAS